MKNLHKTKEELDMDFSKPLGEQAPIIKLNDLAKKKMKHADDIHNYQKKSSLDFTKGMAKMILLGLSVPS
ncbi:hypothetical protein Tco_0844844 [Tanacetum coccineum]